MASAQLSLNSLPPEERAKIPANDPVITDLEFQKEFLLREKKSKTKYLSGNRDERARLYSLWKDKVEAEKRKALEAVAAIERQKVRNAERKEAENARAREIAQKEAETAKELEIYRAKQQAERDISQRNKEISALKVKITAKKTEIKQALANLQKAGEDYRGSFTNIGGTKKTKLEEATLLREKLQSELGILETELVELLNLPIPSVLAAEKVEADYAKMKADIEKNIGKGRIDLLQSRESTALANTYNNIQEARTLGRNSSQFSTNFQFVTPKPLPVGFKKKSVPIPIFSDYQLAPANRMAKKCRNMPGILLFHSMGSGKTRTALGIAASLTKERNSVTIVVPKGLQVPWIDELKALDINTYVVGEAPNQRKIMADLEYASAVPWDGLRYNGKELSPTNISSLESLKNMPIYGRILHEGDEGPEGPFSRPDKKRFINEFRYNIITYDLLLDSKYSALLKDHIVIFDEAHNLLPMYKSSGCDETQQFRLKQVIESSKRIIFLSGTPLQSEMTDLAILINLCQKRSSDPLIPETPELFKEAYYPPKTAEKIKWYANQLSGWALKALVPVGAVAAFFGAPFLAIAGAAVWLGAGPLLGVGYTLLSLDNRNLDTIRLSKDAASYISYFDVMYETPENKPRFPYQSTRYLANQSFQDKIDAAWKVQEQEFDEDQGHMAKPVLIYWNPLIHPEAKTMADALATGKYTLDKPYAMDRPRPVKGISAEGSSDEGQVEHAVPFDSWQESVWVSQFMNLDKESFDIPKMLGTYNEDLAATFGNEKEVKAKFEKLSERLVSKPTIIRDFMETMRVIPNLSPYCLYYEPTMDENEDISINQFNEDIETVGRDIRIRDSYKSFIAKNKLNIDRLRAEGGKQAEITILEEKNNMLQSKLNSSEKLKEEEAEGTTSWKGNKTFVTKIKDIYKEEFDAGQWRPPTDPKAYGALPQIYGNHNIFEVAKFKKAVDLIAASRKKYHFIPLVYSNFDTYGFQLFSAYLNNNGFNHLIIHSSSDFAETNQKILNFSQQPFPRIFGKKPQTKVEIQKWEAENAQEIAHYEKYLEKYPKLTKDVAMKAALLRMVKENHYVPTCILLHPDIKEGLSFTMQPEMIVLEVPSGIGNRDQIYARIIRALSITPQGALGDNEYYEILPQPKFDADNNPMLDSNGNQIYWPGVVRPQYIYDGIFLEENMIAYKEESTPEFKSKSGGKNVGSTTGYGVRRGMIDNVASLRKKKESQELGFSEKLRLSGKELFLSKVARLDISDITASRKAHTARVPRVKKFIHQLIGADNIPRVQVPEILRKIVPTLPSKMRINFPGIRTSSECAGQDDKSVVILPAVSIQVNTASFRTTTTAYWSYLTNAIKGNPKIGTKTWDEYLAGMPVPWQTITPDDFIVEENVKQTDLFEQIKLSFYLQEENGLCTDASKTPTTETCELWSSPKNPGTCRDNELEQIDGGTPTEEMDAAKLKRLAQAKGRQATRKSQKSIPVETLRKLKENQKMVGIASAELTRAALQDTIAEPFVEQISGMVKSMIPQIIDAAAKGADSLDLNLIKNQADAYIQKVKKAQQNNLSDLNTKIGSVQEQISIAAGEEKIRLQGRLSELQSSFEKAKIDAKDKLIAAKKQTEEFVSSAIKMSGLKYSTNTNAILSPPNIGNAASRIPANNASDPGSAGSSPRAAIGGRGKRRTYPTMLKRRATRKNAGRAKTYRKNVKRVSRTRKH